MRLSIHPATFPFYGAFGHCGRYQFELPAPDPLLAYLPLFDPRDVRTISSDELYARVRDEGLPLTRSAVRSGVKRLVEQGFVYEVARGAYARPGEG